MAATVTFPSGFRGSFTIVDSAAAPRVASSGGTLDIDVPLDGRLVLNADDFANLNGSSTVRFRYANGASIVRVSTSNPKGGGPWVWMTKESSNSQEMVNRGDIAETDYFQGFVGPYPAK